MKNRQIFISLIFILQIISWTMVVDAYIPVTYSCCKNYITNQGTLLDNFENLNNWVLDGLNTSYIMVDTINFKEGGQGLKLVANNGNKVYATRNINNDFSKTENFAFDIYVDDVSTFGYFAFYFTSQKNWSKYFYYTTRSSPSKGWNHFIIRKSDLSNTGGEDWNNTMIMFRLTLYPTIGNGTNVTIDNFRYNMSERAKIIFTFDDGTVGDLVAEKILTANNQRAVSFVTISWLNHTNFMTLEDLKKLQNAGWDISSHTISHPNLTAMDDNNMTVELNNSYDWLVSNGFQKSAGFIAYPFGYYNDNVIAKTKQRYIFGRNVMGGIQSHLTPELGNDLYKLKTVEVRNDTTVQLVKSRIDSTIDQGQLIILLFHRIVSNNPTTYEYLESNFKQISDYVKSRGSDIDVITFSDYLVPNMNSFTPVINETVRIYSSGTVDLMTNSKYYLYTPNMTVTPSSGSVNISLNAYGENGDQFISFDESVSNPSIKVQYSIGDRIPNQKYAINIYDNKGVMLKSSYMTANDNGHINYYSTRFGSLRHTEIRPAMAIDETPISGDNDIALPTITENSWLSIEILVIILTLIVSIVYLSNNRTKNNRKFENRRSSK